MIRFHLTHANLKGLIVYTPTKLEAALCHMLFMKLKRRAKGLLYMYNGEKLWNSLDVSTRSIQCKDRFKKNVRNVY